MSPRTPICLSSSDAPLAAAIPAPRDSVIAMITGTEGPAYRPMGAAMIIREGKIVAGSLSSGCIEADVAHHAMQALQAGQGRSLRYGSGSPFMDIRLPCGGGLDITLIPSPDIEILSAIETRLAARAPVDLTIHTTDGRLALAERAERANDALELRLVPDIRFDVFGKGPEALVFSAMTHAAGFATMLYSPDEETVNRSEAPTTWMSGKSAPAAFAPDFRSAVVLFFHDHEWEPLILKAAAATEAFYVGAQGSVSTRMARDAELRAIGVSDDDIARMHGPIGLVRSMRDPRALAISVMAEVLEVAGRATQEWNATIPFPSFLPD